MRRLFAAIVKWVWVVSTILPHVMRLTRRGARLALPSQARRPTGNVARYCYVLEDSHNQ